MLEAENLLSDRRFTETFVASRSARGQGPLKIRYELRERGIGDDLAGQAMEGHRQRWCEQALAARHKRFGVEPPADVRERSRQARFLAQRGFEQDQIRYALESEE